MNPVAPVSPGAYPIKNTFINFSDGVSCPRRRSWAGSGTSSEEPRKLFWESDSQQRSEWDSPSRLLSDLLVGSSDSQQKSDAEFPLSASRTLMYSPKTRTDWYSMQSEGERSKPLDGWHSPKMVTVTPLIPEPPGDWFHAFGSWAQYPPQDDTWAQGSGWGKRPPSTSPRPESGGRHPKALSAKATRLAKTFGPGKNAPMDAPLEQQPKVARKQWSKTAYGVSQAKGARMQANPRALDAPATQHGEARPLALLPLLLDAPGEDASLDANVTTLMIRNIPAYFSQLDLLDDLDKVGYPPHSCFDYFYLPVSFTTRKNLGYAFVNCADSSTARAFMKDFHGQRLPRYDSTKTLEVISAALQGFYPNVDQFLRGRSKRIGNPYFRPYIWIDGVRTALTLESFAEKLRQDAPSLGDELVQKYESTLRKSRGDDSVARA